MNVELERVITLLAMGAFIVASVNSLSSLGDPITKEEAIEISKNSELVKEGLEVAYSFTIETNFYNSSMVEQLKLRHNNKEKYEKVPEGHGIWQVVWCINEYVGGYLIIVVVDAENGTMIYDAKGVRFG